MIEKKTMQLKKQDAFFEIDEDSENEERGDEGEEDEWLKEMKTNNASSSGQKP